MPSDELRHKDVVSGRVRESEYEHIRQHIFNNQETDDMMRASSATQLIRFAVAASRIIGKKSSGNVGALTAAEVLTILGIEAGATDDLTGDEIVILLEALAGAARLSHTGLSDVGSGDHHTKYADAEAVSAVEAAGLTFAENKEIEWVNVLSADGKYSGIVTKQFNGGATIPFGEIVYFKAADSEWYPAKADADSTSGAVLVGIVVLATTDGAACTVLLTGKIRADAKFPAFTISAPIFISAATAGLLTSTRPTGTTGFIVRIVAHALTADEIYFNPDSTYIKLA